MSVARAVCRGASCLLEINIALLPGNLVHSSGSIKDILALEKHNHKAVSPQDIRRFIDHPPSHSIDGNSETFFESYQGLLYLRITSWCPEGAFTFIDRSQGRRLHFPRGLPIRG